MEVVIRVEVGAGAVTGETDVKRRRYLSCKLSGWCLASLDGELMWSVVRRKLGADLLYQPLRGD